MPELANAAIQNILLVEDSPFFRKKIESLLTQELEFKCWCAENRAQCKNLLASPQNAFQLAILDLNLPDAPKGEVVQDVAALGIPILIMTANYSNSSYENLYKAKILDYINKSHINALDYLKRFMIRLEDNHRRTIAVLEDSDVSRKIMCKLLHSHFYKTAEFCKAEDLEEDLNQNAYSAILVDYHLPGKNGFEFMQEFRNRFPSSQTVLIGISASDQPSITADFFRSGANDFIEKPVVNDHFFSRINHNLDQLRNFEKLAELSRFKSHLLGMAAHDLRSPLTIIKGVSELMAREVVGPLNSDQHRLTKTTLHTCNIMVNLLEDLLDISVIESGQLKIELKTVLLEEYFGEHFASLQLLGKEKDISLLFELKLGKNLKAQLDPMKMQQVLYNLVTNAFKYSPRESSVRCSVAILEGQLVITVKDQGMGIDEADQRNLFKPFGRTRNRPTGQEKSIGLGLSIVKNIVEAHQGSISVESRPGVGSLFTVQIPLVKSMA